MSTPRKPLTKQEQIDVDTIAQELTLNRVPLDAKAQKERDLIHAHNRKRAGITKEEKTTKESQQDILSATINNEINTGVQKLIRKKEIISEMKKDISTSLAELKLDPLSLELETNTIILQKIREDHAKIKKFAFEQIQSELIEKSAREKKTISDMKSEAQKKADHYFKKVEETALQHGMPIPEESDFPSDMHPKIKTIKQQEASINNLVTEMQIMLTTIKKNAQQAKIPLSTEIAQLTSSLIEKSDFKTRQEEDMKKIEDFRQDRLAKIRKGASSGEKKIEHVYATLENSEYILHSSESFSSVDNPALGWVTHFAGGLTLPFRAFSVIQGLLDKREEPANRIEKVIFGTLGVAAGIMSLAAVAIVSPIWLVVSVVRDAKNSIQALGKAWEEARNFIPIIKLEINEKKAEFYRLAMQGDNLQKLAKFRQDSDRSGLTSDQWRLATLDREITSGTNEILKLREKRAHQIHNLAKSIFAIAAVITTLLVPPIGVALLIASASYNITDAVGLNPFKRIAQGIRKLFNKPANLYAPLQNHEPIENIERKIEVLKTKIQPLQQHSAPQISPQPPIITSPSVATLMKEMEGGDVALAKDALTSDIVAAKEATENESPTTPEIAHSAAKINESLTEPKIEPELDESTKAEISHSNHH